MVPLVGDVHVHRRFGMSGSTGNDSPCPFPYRATGFQASVHLMCMTRDDVWSDNRSVRDRLYCQGAATAIHTSWR